MITAFTANKSLHLNYVIGQKGLTKILVKGYCGIEAEGGDGIYQVPDWVFDGRAKYGEIPVCAKCMQIAQTLKVPPK